MARNTLIALILAFAFLGLADSWYLAESAASDTPLVCGPGVLEGCNAVAQSPYSRLFGIPLGVYGVVFYGLAILLAAAALTLKIKGTSFYLLVVTGAGAIASVAFLYVQFFLIKALCVYCLASAAFSFALVYLSWVLFARERKLALTPAPSEPAP
jgi:uncharacterized membrane protein